MNRRNRAGEEQISCQLSYSTYYWRPIGPIGRIDNSETIFGIQRRIWQRERIWQPSSRSTRNPTLL